MKFKVDKVKLGQKLPANYTEENYKHAWANCKSSPKSFSPFNRIQQPTPTKKFVLEQSSELPANTITCDFNRKNMFVESVLTAFAKHLPLKIKPDIIWITIMQGFAVHIDKNAEAFRGKFVAHQGKKRIEIRRDQFQKGGVNDWPNCFPEFCTKIEEHLVNPEIRELVECKFTTTNPVDSVVSQIALMDTVKNYFSYRVCTMCGIPEIELAGEASDWIKLREKTRKLLSEFELDDWLHFIPKMT